MNMERQQHYGDNIPGPTWQSVWINLIVKATSEWCEGYYSDSWKTTQQLYAWLPLECKEETKKQVEAIRQRLKEINVFAQKNYSYDYCSMLEHRKRASDNYLYGALLEVHETMEQSLEKHDWICKGSGATPQVAHKKPAHF